MKWKYIKNGVLPKDCELVVGISYLRGIESVYSLEYRDRERLFLVKSTKIDCNRILREDQVEAWVSFEDIYYDFLDKAILDNGVEIIPTK